MPELPEVETVRKSLEQVVVGKRIESADIFLDKIVKCDNSEFISHISDKKIINIDRRGKYLLINLEDNLTIVIHLRMTGRLTAVPASVDREKYTHLVLYLDDGSELRFADMRQFGTVNLINTGNYETIHGLWTLGPEPLADEFTLEIFKERMKRRKTKVKQVLLNQQVVAGIGNIYADEILFEAGINPERSVDQLSHSELTKLHESIKNVIAKGVKYRGTSIKDYVDGFGVKGEFQNYLCVYGQGGQPCPKCGREISKIKVGGRSTHYCSKCQK
ncbi:formamidopyrimidine-DNA glycosylase [Desulfitispora alkaliphila]|uniref:DNA-formamidopyrimidine glycosylase n=1 Tax=Desulfitispora alkaliphila TaxID=622674 RepID=UPI003D23A3E9